MKPTICRACLKVNTELHSIVHDEYRHYYLPDVIFALSGIQIIKSEVDELPQHICFECLTKLIDAHEFRNQLIASDALLRRKSMADVAVMKATNIASAVGSSMDWNDQGLVDNEDLDYLDLDFEVVKIENRVDTQQSDGGRDIVLLESQILKEADEVTSPELKQQKANVSVAKKQKSKTSMDSTFICETCNKSMPNEIVLKRHLNYHSKDKSKCPLCSKLFTHSSNLKRHMLVHKGELPLACDKCPKTFVQADALYDHMKEHRNDPSTTADGTDRIVQHYVMQCELCNEQTESFAQFAKHMRKQHQVTDRSQIKPFKCDVCAMHFASKQGMYRHIDNIHENNRRNLRCRDKNFLCNTCGKSFYTNFHLDVHVRSHTGERPFKCEFCDKAFSQMSGLKMHTFTHTGERPFTCKLCPKTFNQYGHVREHMLTHSAERPHVCTVCDRSFRVKGNLTAHMLIHSGKKPYTCEQCGRRFVQATKLRRHMEKKHASVATMVDGN